jgi:general secretion pathway protein I
MHAKPVGFTLVEVLVALVVFAVLGFTVTSRVGNVVNQTYSLERRTVAHWVAENHLNRMRLSRQNTDEPLPTGRDRERVTMAGREWVVETVVQETSYPLLRRVDLSVLAVTDGREAGPVDSIIAFVGRY